MATASYRFYVGAIAERLGFDDVIATEAEIDETGRLYAKMVGDNVYGPAKLAAIEAWLAREGIDREDCHIRFYSDHVSDAPVLGWADRSEEHTSELQSLMRISYAVFCLKKKK